MFNVICFLCGFVIGFYIHENPWIIQNVGNYLTEISQNISKR